MQIESLSSTENTTHFALQLGTMHAGCEAMTLVVKPDLRQQQKKQHDQKILKSASEVTLPKLQTWFLLNSNSSFGVKTYSD